jgi:hypothetical protein
MQELNLIRKNPANSIVFGIKGLLRGKIEIIREDLIVNLCDVARYADQESLSFNSHGEEQHRNVKLTARAK